MCIISWNVLWSSKYSQQVRTKERIAIFLGQIKFSDFSLTLPPEIKFPDCSIPETKTVCIHPWFSWFCHSDGLSTISIFHPRWTSRQPEWTSRLSNFISVQCHYNNFLQIPHNRYPIACPWEWVSFIWVSFVSCNATWLYMRINLLKPAESWLHPPPLLDKKAAIL